MIALLSLFGPALAQHDYADEARKRMQLDFDLDAVQAELAAPKRPAPAESSDFGGEPMPGPQLPLEPNSTVDAVTVFRDRALVTRVRKLDAGSGSQVVTFEGLPHSIRTDGLAGTLRSGKGRIVGVELVSGTGEVDADDPRTEALRAEALALTEELGEVRDRMEALLGQRAYLRFTLLAQRGEGAPQPALAEVRGTLDYIGSAEAALARDLRKEEEKAKDLAEKLRPLLIKLESPLATGRTVRVEIAGAAGPVEVALRYGVGGASWEPSTNARLLDDGTIQLEYFGVVRQATGEEWKNAALSLSTADASGSSSALPELGAWFLGSGDAGMGSLMAGSGVVGGGTPTAGPPESKLISSDMTATVEGAGAVVFAVDGRRTLAGDGSSTRIPIGSQVFSAKLDWTAVPKLVAEVHRRATIRYEGTVPLMAGSLSTFDGADFLGAGRTSAVVPGEALRLSFGPDDRLKVTRQLVKRRQEYVGGGKKTTRYTFHFRVTVSNLGTEARVVELRDQVPVSEIDRVEVKVVQATEGFREDTTMGPGIHVWDLAVPAGGERTVDLEFTVTAPTEVAATVLYDMQEMMM